jgi:hypothetical protein
MAVATADMLLPAADSFDLRATALSNAAADLPPLTWRSGPRATLERIEHLPGRGVYLVRVRQARTRPGALMRVTGPEGDQVEVLAPLAVRMRRVLRLDETFDDFRRHCQTDPSRQPIARAGLARLLRGATLFEDLVTTIVRTNATWTNGSRSLTQLVRLGAAHAGDRRRRAFPSPARIVRIGEDGLRQRTSLGVKADHVTLLAREVTEGLRDLDQLDAAARTMPVADLRAALADVQGLPPSSLPWVLLLLGHYETPLTDAASLRVALPSSPAPASPARRPEEPAHCGPWTGLVAWFDHWLHSGHAAVAGLRRG